MATPTNPGWATGYVPSADEWAEAFSSKVDFPAPLNQGGTGAQSAFSANYNIAQRQLIAVDGVTANALSFYGVSTSVDAFTVDLPPLDSLANGDWIQFIDIDNDASTNNITLQANGTDEIDFNGSVSGSQVITTDGAYVMLMINNGVWTMVQFATSGSVVLPGPITSSGLTESTATLLGRTTAATGPVEEIEPDAGLVLAAGKLQVNRLFNFSIVGSAPLESEELAAVTPPLGETWTFPGDLAGSSGLKLSGGTSPAAQYDIDVKLNGASVATISIDTSGVVTFSTASGDPFSVVGGTDALSIAAPSSTDATVGFTFLLVALASAT